jgi:transmembrane sensor
MNADSRNPRRETKAAAIALAAARWMARRDRGLTPLEAEELRRWEAADPRHGAELAQIEAAWRGFDLARAAPDLVAMAGELDRCTTLGCRPRFRAWFHGFAAVAAIALTFGISWWRLATVDPTRDTETGGYQIIESEAQERALPDGSLVLVRGDSAVHVEFTATERRIRLLRGEAHFKVEKDLQRPFVVSAAEAAVRAVGTAFNVRIYSDNVEVLVTAGTVQVAKTSAMSSANPLAPSVTAGQRAVVARNATSGESVEIEVSAVPPAEVDQALAWQSKRFVFDRTPLAEAVAAFNRNAAGTSGVQLVIGDAALGTRRLGGTFRAANVDGFVRLLERSVEVRTERRGNTVVLLPIR